MPEAFINRFATANPPHDVHDAFLRFGQLMLKGDKRRVALFDRMAERSGIAHRYFFLSPARTVGEWMPKVFIVWARFPTPRRGWKSSRTAPPR